MTTEDVSKRTGNCGEHREPDPIPKLGLNHAETARAIGVSKITLHRLVARGLIRPNQDLRNNVFYIKEIERYLRDSMK